MVGFDIFKTNKTGILLFPDKKRLWPQQVYLNQKWKLDSLFQICIHYLRSLYYIHIFIVHILLEFHTRLANPKLSLFQNKSAVSQNKVNT